MQTARQVQEIKGMTQLEFETFISYVLGMAPLPDDSMTLRIIVGLIWSVPILLAMWQWDKWRSKE
jgi:hypothetical protein